VLCYSERGHHDRAYVVLPRATRREPPAGRDDGEQQKSCPAALARAPASRSTHIRHNYTSEVQISLWPHECPRPRVAESFSLGSWHIDVQQTPSAGTLRACDMHDGLNPSRLELIRAFRVSICEICPWMPNLQDLTLLMPFFKSRWYRQAFDVRL